MKYRYLLALTLSALLLAGCTKPAPNTSITETEASVTETTVATAETTTAVTSVTEETTVTTTAPVPEKLAEKDIGGGYTIYATEKNDEYTLHLADENGETDSMSITNVEYDWYIDCYWQPIFYDFDLPPCFSVYTYTGDIIQLHYRLYFAIDGKIREAEWYLDGEKLDSLNYPLLRCYGNGDSFNAYLPFEWDEDYNWLDITKCTFTFDENKLRFEGTSQRPITHEGTAKAAADALDELTKLRWELRTCECSDELVDDVYNEITADGLRTKDEFMDRLHKFCTEESAEEIFTALFEGEYKASDGKLYRVEGALNPFTYMVIDNVLETDNGITAKIYSYAFGQDRPNYINPPLYIDFVQENGIWKIASMPYETTTQEQPDPTEKIWNFLSDSDYTDGHTTDLYFLFDFNGDNFPEVAFVGWYIDIPYMNVYDLSSGKPVSLGSTHQGLSPYSDDRECIGLYCNDKGEYFFHSLSYYAIKNSNGWKHVMERYITPVDFDNHTVEFIPDPTEQRNFDNEADAEKYKERVFKELEPLTLVTELKTSYMAEDSGDEEAFREMYSGDWKINCRHVSAGNEFIDYKYTKELPSTTDIGDLADKAVQCLMESEHYKDAEHIKEIYDTHKPKKLDPFFDENGTLTPVFSEAYVDDFDNDGKTEAFIVVDMPFYTGDCLIRNYLIFADSSGNMSVIEDYHGINLEAVLDYGEFKHIAFGGYGWIGADMHSNLFGVVDGKAVDFYSLRGEFVKENCFVSTFGHQGIGDFMYYDTVTKEYRTIVGKEIPLDTIKEMDKDNVLADYYTANENGSKITAQLVGGKYYLLMYLMDPGTVYTYENGKFILQENSNVRKSWATPNSVYDIDIDKALAEMKPVE